MILYFIQFLFTLQSLGNKNWPCAQFLFTLQFLLNKN